MNTEAPSLWRQIAHNGLWANNPALVQILGLCPLLAVSNSAINGLGLGLATLLVLLLSNTLISLASPFIPKEIRLPIFVMLIASLVTVVELLMNAYFHRLHLALGIFVPLIVTNCIIIGRAESFASRNRVAPAAFDGLMQGSGFCAVLFLLGAIREILGSGTLFAGAAQFFGPGAAVLTLRIPAIETPLLLAILPPGAFLVLGLLIAGKNALDARRLARRSKKIMPHEMPASTRSELSP